MAFLDVTTSYHNPDVVVVLVKLTAETRLNLRPGDAFEPTLYWHRLSHLYTVFLFEFSFASPTMVLVCNINMYETRDPVSRCDVFACDDAAAQPSLSECGDRWVRGTAQVGLMGGILIFILWFVCFFSLWEDDDRVDVSVGLLKKDKKKKELIWYQSFQATSLLDCVSFNYFTLKFLLVKYLKRGKRITVHKSCINLNFPIAFFIVLAWKQFYQKKGSCFKKKKRKKNVMLYIFITALTNSLQNPLFFVRIHAVRNKIYIYIYYLLPFVLWSCL